MKEFIDKLICRLEEEVKYQYKKYDETDKYEQVSARRARSRMAQCFDASITIIKELAEEYINCSTDTSTKVSEMPTGWISCSEKQPPKPRFKEDTYLIQQSEVVAPFSAYWNGECWTDVLDDEIENVIAWMPLPAPYTEGE